MEQEEEELFGNNYKNDAEEVMVVGDGAGDEGDGGRRWTRVRRDSGRGDVDGWWRMGWWRRYRNMKWRMK